MNRRSFMTAILAAGCAPAIVKAGSLMRVNPAIVDPYKLAAWREGSIIVMSGDSLIYSITPPDFWGPSIPEMFAAHQRGMTARSRRLLEIA